MTRILVPGHRILFLDQLLLFVSLGLASAQQQYFRIEPRDVRVHEGGEATLVCEIGNQAGQVQWTKDGFALGFDPIIPFYPRYNMIGDKHNGVYNLRILNASLSDDAEFQCQVGPARFNKAIRANASLTVISPPSSIEIVDHAANAKIEIKENQQLLLTCLVKNAKPAASIVWYRENVELKLDNREDVTTEVTTPSGGKTKRYNVESRIKLRPTAEDDYADYTCEARHEALPPDMPMRVTVKLSVLYPPGAPYIEGYTEGETIRKGQTVELVCRSRGGNPPAQLIWYKNDTQVQMSYRTEGRLSENIYTFTADTTDNHAKYRCEASNIMSSAVLKAEVVLAVLFAPSHVTISGPTEAKVGDLVPLECTTANSNPPAEVKWVVGGLQVRNATSRTVTSPEGGWITTSNITTLIGPNERSLVVICHGLNMQLTENVVGTHTINVLYPPNPPLIYGYNEGVSVPAGTLQKISCMSSGGNPPATLTWYKNDHKINSVSKISEPGRSVSAELTIITNMTDNGARYKCEASNSATEIPLFKEIMLRVQFAPQTVKITKKPKKFKPGRKGNLTCESSSSNPPARLSWWRGRDGIRIPGISNDTKPGLYGGTVSTNVLELDITPELNGEVYTCQATNEVLQRSVHDAITLEVMYKPVFQDPPQEKQYVEMGESTVIKLETKGNPEDITYTWTKEGTPVLPKKDSAINTRIVSDGPMLNISNAQKEDAGSYVCEAVNSEGSTTIQIDVVVQYPPSITEIPPSVLVGEEEEARLSCKADGNPLEEDMIKWQRDDFDFAGRTTQTFQDGTSFLVIRQPRKEDIGPFECVVNNGIGEEAVNSTFLMVKYKPEVDTSPQIAKAASNRGDTGRLICRASGAPKVRFKWSREGASITVNSSKYVIEHHQLDFITFETVLLVNLVHSSDYGLYECVARNEMGFTTHQVKLDITSAPETPILLTVLNVTHEAVVLSWIPGFNGGMEQTYQIRYKKVGSDITKYVDVNPSNATTFTVTGLALGTEYLFSIMAKNKLGNSGFLKDIVKAKTSTEAPPSSSPSSDGENQGGQIPKVVIIVITIVGTALLVLNVVLIACFVRRRTKKRLTAASDQGSSKSATIEMYAPSSYNETVTGETLSSISEKSESYSNGDSNEDYLDDTSKPAVSTYLIDQIEPPAQYSYRPHDGQSSQHNTLTRHKPNNFDGDDDMYADALRRNAYNHTIGDKSPYGSTTPQPPSHISDTYYNISPDARYIPYPPPGFGRPQPVGNGSLRHNIPPDVTMSHNHLPLPAQNGPVGVGRTNGPTSPVRSQPIQTPMLSTFNPNVTHPSMSVSDGRPLETEGHLV